jgi:hypothetical protein
MNKKEQQASTKESVWRHKFAAKYNQEITRRAIELRDNKEGRPADPVKAGTISIKWQNKATVELYNTLVTHKEKLQVEQQLQEEKRRKEVERERRLHPTVEQQRMLVLFSFSSRVCPLMFFTL